MLCVIARIDSAAAERLVKLEEVPERFGIPPQNPHGHITLATYTGEEEEKFISSCKAILSGYKRFSVHYENIEVWDSASGARTVLVATPRKEKTLAAIQREISKGWAENLNQWTQPGAWNPHTTLYICSKDRSWEGCGGHAERVFPLRRTDRPD